MEAILAFVLLKTQVLNKRFDKLTVREFVENRSFVVLQMVPETTLSRLVLNCIVFQHPSKHTNSDKTSSDATNPSVHMIEYSNPGFKVVQEIHFCQSP